MAEDTNTAQNSLNITATPVEGKNYVHLEWTNLGAGYTYTVYEKGENDPVTQSIPSKTNVKVLNIYPSVGNNLKGWMENPNSENEKGYGKGLISVDEVDIDVFNVNPVASLKDGNGNWKYDVIYFGAWDGSNNKNFNDTAVGYIENFIKEGRGVLAGHDTIGCYTGGNTGLNKLRSYFNIKVGNWCNDYTGLDEGYKYTSAFMGSDIQIKKKGLLTNYPWIIGDVGTKLKVPISHSTSNFALGDIWMTYPDNALWASNSNAPDSLKKLNNFYLTTWNNCAMIQTGHSSGAATSDEQKLIANTLFYLAQLTTDTFCDDHKGQDLTGPDKVNITNVETDGTNVNVTYSKSNDNGTKYEYYVKASDGNPTNDITSSTVSITNTSGMAKYSYVIDNVENTEPNKKSPTTTDLSISVPLSVLDLLKPIYIHIKAIDNVDNASETTHYKYIGAMKYIDAVSIKLNKTEMTLKEEELDQLIAITDPASMEIIWASGDTSVATVDENGKVTAVKKGQAVITATIKDSNLSAACTVTVKKKIILNVEPEKYKIHLNENAVVDYTINNIKNITAEDARIKYDTTKLKFLGANEEEAITLVRLEEDKDELRIITASQGKSKIINDKKILLKLYFKAIASGEASIDIIKGKVTDGIEMEQDLIDDECGETTIIIDDVIVEDVNRNGEFTLLDLGIDARHLGEDPKTLPQYNTDQVVNGAIDSDDLLKIGEYMLENPYYKFR